MMTKIVDKMTTDLDPEHIKTATRKRSGLDERRIAQVNEERPRSPWPRA